MSNSATLNKDGWENTITGLGTSRDKRTGGRIKFAPRNTSRTEWDELFASDDLAATLVELPAREMVRQWITLNVDDTSEQKEKDSARTEQSTEQQVNDAKLMSQFLDDIDAQQKIHEALVWSRVFGGCLLFMGIDDGQELDQPLNEERIRSFKFLTVLDRWEVHIQSTVQDVKNPSYGQPELYTIQTSTTTGHGFVESQTVHATRFVRFDGVLTSRRRMAENGGWADSVYTRTAEVLRDFGLAWAGVAHLMQDASQAVLKIKGLANALASDSDDLVLTRMTALDMCRSIARAIPIDADGEDFMRVATPFDGIPQTMDRFALRLAAAARMPATLLFGQSPAGLNSTGDGDITFFYDQIKAMQEAKLRPVLNRIIELGFKSAEGPTRGKEPENWSFDFNPLWQLTDKEEAELRKTQAETDQIYIVNGVVTEEEIAISRFGGDRYSTETVLDMGQREEDALAEENEPEIDLEAMASFAQNAANPPPLPTAQPNQSAQSPIPAQNQDGFRTDRVEKRGDKWVVLSMDGEILGRHSTRKEALKQLAAIEASKHS